MLQDVAEDEIDAALVWGPLAGYWVKELSPDLVITPLAPDPGHERLDSRISIGIRYNEPAWKHRLNARREQHKAETEQILASYVVPLLDDQDTVGVQSRLRLAHTDTIPKVAQTLKKT